MRFSRQEYWSGLPFPSPGDLPNRGIEHGSPATQADSLPTELLGKPYLLVITLNINGLNVPIRRHRVTEWIKKKKKKLLSICCLYEIDFKPKDIAD